MRRLAGIFGDYKVGGFGNWASPYLHMLYTADPTLESYDLETEIGPITIPVVSFPSVRKIPFPD